MSDTIVRRLDAIPMECPHCRRDVGHIVWFTKPMYDSQYKVGTEANAVALLTCPTCYKPSSAIFKARPRGAGEYGEREHRLIGTIDMHRDWHLHSMWPKPERPDTPEHLPDEVDSRIKKAESSRIKKEFEYAAMMYGKTLEMAFKELYPTVKKTSLNERIKYLGETKKIMPELADLAGQLRLIRNDSMHESKEPDETEVETLAATTKLILQYLFTLPKKLEMLKAPAHAVSP